MSIEKTELTPFDIINTKNNPDTGDDFDSNDDPNLIGDGGDDPDTGDDPNTGDDPDTGDDTDNGDDSSAGDDPNTGDNTNTGDDPGTEDDKGLVKYAVDTFKQKQLLPADFELSEEDTEDTLRQKLHEYNKEVLYNTIKDEVLKDLAEKEGLTPQMISEVKLKHYGIQDQEIIKLNAFKSLSSHEFDPESETFEAEARDFLKIYYTLKELTPQKIESNIESDLKDDGILTIIGDYQKELGGKAKTLAQEISDKEKAKAKADEDKKVADRQKTLSFLEKRVIDSVEYSKEDMDFVTKAMFEKTEVVEIGGQKYMTTLENKKRIEIAADDEKALAARIRFILGEKGSGTDPVKKVRSDLKNSLVNYVKTREPKTIVPKTGASIAKRQIEARPIN